MVTSRSCYLNATAALAAIVCAPTLSAQSVVADFPRAGDAWLTANPGAVRVAYDQYYPGVTPSLACLSGGTDPVPLAVPGGTVTVSAFDAVGTPICPIGDRSSVRSVSDASLLGGGMVVLEFEPPISAFYSMFGSVALGKDVTMVLFSPAGDWLDTVFSSPSPHDANAFGHGFVSSAPIGRIEFTSTDTSTVLQGAYRFIQSGESTLGTVEIPGYGGQYGDTVYFDFGCVFALDSDGDGLLDLDEINFYGTDPAIPDTDGDGLLDGTEILMAEENAGSCPDPLVFDSDGDTLGDGMEVAMGTNPCNADSDGDTIPDNIDPLPLDPGGTMDWLETELRQLSIEVDMLDLALFDAPNDNARSGRRNATCNKLSSAANAVAVGDYVDAIDLLESLRAKLDGLQHPKDWMVECLERDQLAETVEYLVLVLEYGG